MKRLLMLTLLLWAMTAVAQDDIRFGRGHLRIVWLTERAVRLQYFEGALDSELPEWVYVEQPTVKCRRSVRKGITTLRTREASVSIDVKGLTVSIADAQGHEVFRATSHELRPHDVAGLSTQEATLRIATHADEHHYGLGQFQDGFTNIRGLTRRLTQVNTQISIPVLLSSRGYGLVWNNYGLTEFNPSESIVRLQADKPTPNPSRGEGSLITSIKENVKNNASQAPLPSGGAGGGLQGDEPSTGRFAGDILVPEDGRYALLLDVGQKMARRHHLVVDGDTLLDCRNLWLPPTASAFATLTKGRHRIEAELEKNDQPTVGWRLAEAHSSTLQEGTTETLLRSPVSTVVDYTVLVGQAEECIGQLHRLTGSVPLLPLWALGYIHCRERFHSQQELLATAQQFREENIPMDLIVQDWQYWGRRGWNAMEFDPDDYPDPRAMTDSLHQMNLRLMLSVWSRIDKTSTLGQDMEQRGYYIPGTDWIDFFRPDAADHYWQNFRSRLLPTGIDAWWQDATEPENDDLVGRRVGNNAYAGEQVRNVFPLRVCQTVADGLHNAQPGRRSMILTRCGFTGIQRYGVAMWTGDVGHDWATLRRQFSAGLGMQAAGQPWWTYDAGGFFRPENQYTDTAYQECMLRWIEASVFLPLMRVHGYQSDTEPWRYLPETRDIFVESIRQRYRLLPYIYSETAAGALMRPLLFDFAHDDEALRQETEYMFGRSLLVNPVTAPMSVLQQGSQPTWPTYLPQHEAGWYDYHTGRHHRGGQTVNAAIDLAHIPVFVKGGSILPEAAADIQHTGQLPQSPLVLTVYPGADAHFTLREDDGTTMAYTRGQRAQINLHWDDARRQLTIGQREGHYEGMSATRLFQIRLVGGTTQFCLYTGQPATISFDSKETGSPLPLCVKPAGGPQWISGDSSAAVPYMGRDFTIGKKKINRAMLRATALGVCTMQLNGQPVSNSRLEPGESQWDQTVVYSTFDVTHLLRRGQNRLLAIVGGGLYHVQSVSGRYSKPEIHNTGTPALLAELLITYADGTIETIATDHTWHTAPSPVVASNWWGGEDYDARLEATAKTNISHWPLATVISQPTTNLPIENDAHFGGPGHRSPIGTLRPREHEPVEVVETWTATGITPLANGDYVVDFGQNFAGIFEFTLQGKRGQTLRFQTSEQLNADGTVNAQECYCGPIVVFDTYTFGRDGMATWSPQLMYHGFRYMQVSGLDAMPRREDFRALRLRVAAAATGQFHTSHPLINQIHRICRNAIESQLFNVFTDCPQREKMGWLDVPNQMYNSIALNFDFSRLSRKIAQDCFDAQSAYAGTTREGKVPSTVPHFFNDWDDDPNWGGAAILVPYRTWKTYGDTTLVRRHYDGMRRLIDYYTRLAGESHVMPSSAYSRLSDWGQGSSGLDHETAPEFTITCTYYYLLTVMAEMATLAGHADDAATFLRLAGQTRAAFCQRFFGLAVDETPSPDLQMPLLQNVQGPCTKCTRPMYETYKAHVRNVQGPCTKPDSTKPHAITAEEADILARTLPAMNQAELDMPLYYGLIPDNLRQHVADQLATKVAADGYKIKTGECGLKPVLMSLARYGYNDIVWQMACQRDYPSYGYFVDNGCTTTPELWNMRYSQNHCMLAHIEEWFYTCLAGIQNAGTAYDHVHLQPYVPANLDSLSASVNTPRGVIASEYHRQADGTISFHFSIPTGTTATIALPDGSTREVGAGEFETTINLHKQ